MLNAIKKSRVGKCECESVKLQRLLWLPSFALSPSYFRTFAPLPSNFHLCKYELSASHLRFIAASSHFCLFAFATKKMREYDDIIAKLQRRIIDSSVSPSPLHFRNFAIAPSHFVSPRFTSHLYTLGSSPFYFSPSHRSIFSLSLLSHRIFTFATSHFRQCTFALSPSHLRASPSHLWTIAPSPSHYSHSHIFDLKAKVKVTLSEQHSYVELDENV